jgi:hypothetical protein
MWDMKCMIIPIITGGTGRVTKNVKKFGEPFQENI